jgi:hypothetical protein
MSDQTKPEPKLLYENCKNLQQSIFSSQFPGLTGITATQVQVSTDTTDTTGTTGTQGGKKISKKILSRKRDNKRKTIKKRKSRHQRLK